MRHIKLFEDYDNIGEDDLIPLIQGMMNKIKNDTDDFLQKWRLELSIIPEYDRWKFQKVFREWNDFRSIKHRELTNEISSLLLKNEHLFDKYIGSKLKPLEILDWVDKCFSKFMAKVIPNEDGEISYESLATKLLKISPEDAGGIYVPDYFPSDLKKDLDTIRTISNMGLLNTD